MRILVIEDEERLLRVLIKALREEGYAVDGSADGEEGLYKALNFEYDALILDLMLPGKSGWEVLESFRKKSAAPVLVLTARDAISDRIRGLDAGADDYLIKPFDLGELFARLRVIIRRHVGRTQALLDLGDVIVDPRSRTVTQHGVGVNLTPREFAILEYLTTHRGKVVSRTELFEHLFDENDDSLSNLIDVHIHGIRKKLRADLIITRKGEGYIVP